MRNGILFLLLMMGGFCLPRPVHSARDSAFPGRSPAADLAGAYLKGPIALIPDPDFGRGLDRESLFPYKQMKIAASPDGSVFLSNTRDHSIYKFSADGTLLAKFGKKGQGPGDLTSPGDLSILDGTTLVVGEFLSARRISLFDLDGAFCRLFKTSGPPANPTALRDGMIAFVAITGTLEARGEEFDIVNSNKIMILNTATGKERLVATIKTSLNAPKDGEVKIARSAEGDLLVGHSIRPELEVYSPYGVRKTEIKLDIEPLRVTKKIAEAHQAKLVIGGKLQVMPMAEVLPYYCDFTVDEDGNILVFKMAEDPKAGPIIFQVYGPDGRLLGETGLDRGRFDLPLDRFLRYRLAFTSRGIFGILAERGDELEIPRLFRVRLGS